MHSCSIMVESMSATNSRLRRSASGCTTTSMGWSFSAVRSRTATALSSAPPGVKGMSAAMPGSSTRTSIAVASTPTASAIAASSSAGRAGLEMRVAT